MSTCSKSLRAHTGAAEPFRNGYRRLCRTHSRGQTSACQVQLGPPFGRQNAFCWLLPLQDCAMAWTYLTVAAVPTAPIPLPVGTAYAVWTGQQAGKAISVFQADRQADLEQGATCTPPTRCRAKSAMRAILFSCELLRIHNSAYRQADASARKRRWPADRRPHRGLDGQASAEWEVFSLRSCRRVCRRVGSRPAGARRSRSPRCLPGTMPRALYLPG